MSKGSRPRPYSVSLSDYDKNFDAIFRRPDVKKDEVAEDQTVNLSEEEIKVKQEEK